MNASADILAPDALAGSMLLPGPYGRPLARAIFKSRPADFRVDEQLHLALDGTGEHLWLKIRKVGLDTETVCAALQCVCDVNSADIGISGRKDKHAITTQWISVRTARQVQDIAMALRDRAADSDGELTVLDAQRHTRKLRHGTHRGNAFTVMLRSMEPLTAEGNAGEPDQQDEERSALRNLIDTRLALLAGSGFVNYLGPQRFGRDGRNLIRARQWLARATSRKARRATRLQRSLWLSAARSSLFNQVCAARVNAGNWQELLAGEPCMLSGRRSFFLPDALDGELIRRLQEWDIHPSAPWWGRGSNPATDDCFELETAALHRERVLMEGLEQAGLAQERRALRARPEQLQWSWLDERTLKLNFELEKGVFATTMLSAFAELQELH